jgi:hypothetical protein
MIEKSKMICATSLFVEGLKSKNELDEKLNNTIYANNNSFKKVDTTLYNKTIIGVASVLLAILLSLSFYIILNRRQKNNNLDLVNELNNTKATIENKLVKELEKQTGLLEIKVNNISNSNNISEIESKTVDHSLALKVASEINLIERNIKLMDNKTKGLKQIQHSIIKLKDNLAVNGYEIPVLLDMPYNQGMRVIITSSIPDENLSKGEEIISKIIIPQVNFNDKMIQTAQIEVSVGY